MSCPGRSTGRYSDEVARFGALAPSQSHKVSP